jgi:hypothetical protein
MAGAIVLKDSSVFSPNDLHAFNSLLPQFRRKQPAGGSNTRASRRKKYM